jgi:type I restriction enzyme, S subunit
MSDSFERVRLNEILKLDRQGIDPASIDPAAEYVGLDSISSEGHIRRGTTAGSAEVRSTKYRFTKHHILFGKLRPYLRKVAAPDFDGICSTDILPLLPSASVHRRYLLHWLRTDEITRLATKESSGANLPRLSPKALLSFEIPVPRTLDDQRRIAAVLDKVEALRMERQESLKLTERFLQSVFNEMFGDPVMNSKSFPVRQLGDFFLSRREGAKCGPFGSALKKSDSQTTGVPVWGIDNISMEGRFVDTAFTRISYKKFEALRSYEAKNGDILISRAGTVGKMCVVNTTEKAAIIGSNLIRLRLNPERLSPHWFVALMHYNKGRVGRLRSGPDGAFTHMSTKVLKSLEFPYPSPELQSEFLAICRAAEVFNEPAMASVRHLDRLFGSLQQRAFRGNLDLSRLRLEAEEESLVVVPSPESVTIQGRYNRRGSFIAPPEIEAQMIALESKLNSEPNESIQWSEDYFKYRTLSQVLLPPFSFTDIWKAVEHDIEEPNYNTVKAKVFEYLEDGTLEQQFDEERKEIVFQPRT